MGPRRTAVLNGVEAAYQVKEPTHAWLAKLVAELAPTLDTGVGVQGFHARFEGDRRVLEEPVLLGGTAAWRDQWRENWWDPVIQALDSRTLRGVLGFGTVFSAQQLWDAGARGIPTLDAHLEALAQVGWSAPFRRPGTTNKLFYVDSLNLCALTPSGEGVAIVANREEVLSTSELRAARRRFARLAAHVTTALRAREALGGQPLTPERGEAVLTPEGRVLHAVGDA